MFKCSSFLATVLLGAPSASADTLAPMPMMQLDFPVLAVGESGLIRLHVPAHDGWGAGPYYGVVIKEQFSDYDPGYRLTTIHCPYGYYRRNYNNIEGSCSTMESGSHAALEIVIEVQNVGAADGETFLKTGLVSNVFGNGRTFAPLRLRGVR